MLIFSGVTAILFIVYPLLRYGRHGLKIPYALPVLMYFALLGMGYIIVEVVLIQRFTLFIGYPSRAIAVTIFGMLVFSAFGSLVGKRMITSVRGLKYALGLIAVNLVLYILVLPLILQSLFALAEWLRILLTIIIIAPLGFTLGIPFPTGLHRLGLRAQALIPWAWGVNGVFSVLGSVLVILISMETSFTIALFVAAIFYISAVFVSAYLWKTEIVKPLNSG
jgi:hypothetical protein